MKPIERRLAALEGKRSTAMIHTKVMENGTAWLQIELAEVLIMLPDNGRDNVGAENGR